MAGHSKWANIKYRKEKSDRQKGKAFSRLAKEIITAVKIGGADPKSNPRLRLAIQKARTANMPSDNIERNIKKALGSDQADYQEVTYELYGYGGVGIIVEVMTDNKNRTASEMRIATNKCGGTIAAPGSVAFNFDKKGVIQVNKKSIEEEKLFALAIEAGADDFEGADETFMVLTAPTALYLIKEKLDELGVVSDEAEIEMIPKNTINCDEEAKTANLALIEWLENLEDVDAVYHNMEL